MPWHSSFATPGLGFADLHADWMDSSQSKVASTTDL